MRPPILRIGCIGLAVLGIVGLVSLAVRTNDTDTPQPTATPDTQSTTIFGVSVSPKSYQAPDFAEFFSRAKEAGGALTWAGDWEELGTDGSGAQAITRLAKEHGLLPVMIATVFTSGFQPGEFSLLRPLTDEQMERSRSDAEAYAREHQPDFFGLGIEANLLAEHSPEDFERFVELFDQSARAIKAASPRTQVFTVFQLERLRGLQGGLFGGTHDPTAASWHLLSKFPAADVVAFTTYPYLVYQTPAEIPDDYYREIMVHTEKAVAFTEVGWPSQTVAPGWESNPEEQVAFIERFHTLSEPLSPQVIIWPFLFDQDLPEPFASIGLLTREGEAKPGWTTWQTL